MAEIIPDYGDVNTCLQKRNGTTMPQTMRRDMPTMQGGCLASCRGHVLVQNIGNTIARDRLAVPVVEDWIISTSITHAGQPLQGIDSLTPQGTVADFIALSLKTDVSWLDQAQILNTNGNCFTDPCAGVI